MRFLSLLVLLFAACNQSNQYSVPPPDDPIDSTLHKRDSVYLREKSPANDSASAQNKPLTARDSALLKHAEKLLPLLKNNDFRELANYVHPDSGLFFSAFANVVKDGGARLSVADLRNPATPSRIVNWGAFDYKDSSQYVSINTYFDNEVYDVDFINAPIKSVNQFHEKGTDINNIKEAFPGADFVEFHFPGFEPQYEGLDFRSLRLVFRYIVKNGIDTPYLTGIVHDRWTP